MKVPERNSLADGDVEKTVCLLTVIECCLDKLGGVAADANALTTCIVDASNIRMSECSRKKTFVGAALCSGCVKRCSYMIRVTEGLPR